MKQDWKKYAAAQYSDVDVEKAFLDQAYIFIQNKATPLMKDPHKLGFEIVFKNDSNTKMVGIFVFRVNRELLYAPVFFLNGSVKGTDLLYRHGVKKFVCLTNDWCQYLISLEAYKEGSAITRDTSEGRNGINLEDLVTPPNYSNKRASYNELVELNPNLPTGEDLLNEFEKQAGSSEESLLKKFILEDGGYNAVELLTKKAESNLEFADHLIRHVGLDNVMPKELNEHTRNNKHDFEGVIFKKAYTEKAAEDGYNVLDTRKDIIGKVYKNEDSVDKSETVTDRFMHSFSHVVNLLHEDGTSSEHKVAAVENSDRDVILFSQDGWDKKDINDLYLLGEKEASESNITTTKEIEKGKWYLEKAFNEYNKEAGVSEPFYVTEILDSVSDGIDRYAVKYASGDEGIKYNDLSLDSEFVPCGNHAPVGCATKESFKQLVKGAGLSEVKVEPRGNYFVVTSVKGVSSEMSKIASCAFLMAELDFGKEAAFDIMKQAENGRVSYYYAPVHEKQATMRLRNVPEFYEGFDNTFQVATDRPEQDSVLVDVTNPEAPESRVGDRMKFDDIGSVQTQTPEGLAQIAQETGESSLFEHGLVGSLVNTFDSTVMIDKYMSSLEDGLDKMGRILFLFYWKPNDFSQMYGSDDQQALENKLLSNFKSYGDLVLELIKKTKSVSNGNIGAGNND